MACCGSGASAGSVPGRCRLQPDSLPLAEGLVEVLGSEAALTAALSGGDDYELLVTLPPPRLLKRKCSWPS